MFQAWPVKIMMTAASSSPTLLCRKSATRARISPGMKPSTGMLWRMSSSGIRMRSARRWRSEVRTPAWRAGGGYGSTPASSVARVEPEADQCHRSAVAVVPRVDDALEVGADLDVLADLEAVVRLEDPFPAVVQPPV